MPIPSAQPRDLWSLALDAVYIDPEELLVAMEAATAKGELDSRTRVLIRDSYLALKKRWGDLDNRLSPDARNQIAIFLVEDFGDRGFTTLEHRLMDATQPQTVLTFLRELGASLDKPCRLNIGGSCGLILRNVLQRRTDDIDAVDQIPDLLREQHGLLEDLARRYGIRLAHFQSHYLPGGWESRLQSLDVFGELQVFLVDPVDILLGKLFSRRTRDLDDLRASEQSVGWESLAERMKSSGQTLLAEPDLRANAERNWYILTGQSLPA